MDLRRIVPSLRPALFVAVIGTFTPLRAQSAALADSAPPFWRAPWIKTHPSPTSTVLALPGGIVEILGLQRWSPEAIEDSFAVKAPGESITSHACAAALRYQLGFAEAAALTFKGSDSIQPRVVVAVIEPEDSARVRHRSLPLDTMPAHRQAPWTALVDLAAQRPLVFMIIVSTRLSSRAAGKALEVPTRFWADSLVFRETWALLDRHQQLEDLTEATRILRSSPYLYDRVGAIAVLSSFPRQDAAWHSLAGALLESDGAARQQAFQLLALFAGATPRSVDWAPAAADLHAILDGSSLFSLLSLFPTLVQTEISPTLAPALLKGGGRAVLMYAGAQQPELREPALAFLRHMSGKDFGRDVTRWQAWIGTL